jgi:hypothetical protein
VKLYLGLGKGPSVKRKNKPDNKSKEESMPGSNRHFIDPQAAYVSAQRSAIAVLVELALLGLAGWQGHMLFFEAPVTDKTLIGLLMFYIPFMMFGMLYTLSLNLQPVHFKFVTERLYFVAKALLLPINALLSYAVLYRAFGLIDGEVPTSDPVTCLYFSVLTWTTLGYGDVRPSRSARLLAASEAVVGYIVMAALIAVFATYLRYFRNRSYAERGLPQE